MTLLWAFAACMAAELIGYFLHRLLHSGKVRILSRSHMMHHLEFYGPLDAMRPGTKFLDATTDRVALGNIGLEWLVPSGLILAAFLIAFRLLRVPWLYQTTFVIVALSWSFLMFSYLHDSMHVQQFWMEKAGLLRRWFVQARRLHDIHHRALDDRGKMDKNFGIGLFVFDRLFGTLQAEERIFNWTGYEAAKRRYSVSSSVNDANI